VLAKLQGKGILEQPEERLRAQTPLSHASE
jgi:hypothetical protein